MSFLFGHDFNGDYGMNKSKERVKKILSIYGMNSFEQQFVKIKKKIESRKPDILCFQEVLPDVAVILKRELKEYVFVGAGRDKNLDGEQTTIAFHRERFSLLFCDMFWLSRTPYQPGSRYENQSSCPHTCTTVLLRDEKSKEVFRIFNAHLDHESGDARMEALKQIEAYRQELSRSRFLLYPDAPTLLVGDFNTEPDSPEISMLTQQFGWRDLTWDVAGTFHGFASVNPMKKIDSVFATPEIKRLQCQLWTEEENGVYLSEHYPLELTISFSKSDWINQPFEKGTLKSQRFRIPSMIVTQNQTLLAAADARWAHGQDCAGNLETVLARSVNDGHSWQHSFVNHYEDVVDGSQRCIFSAGFIDPTMVQDRKGRIYLLCDLCPPYVGGWACQGVVCGQEGGGRHINGKLALKDLESYEYAETQELNEKTYPYYLGEENENGMAPVLRLSDDTSYDGYMVDCEMYLYQWKNGRLEPIWIHQLGEDGQPLERLIQANIFFAASPIKVYPTFYIICRTSDDDGKTWSRMRIISDQIASRGFTATCPGCGYSYLYQGKERVLFPIYDNNLRTEFTSIIYTEDRGKTWLRGNRAKDTGKKENGEYIKSSESQLVELPDGTLRMYSRNIVGEISYSDSTDGGMNWSSFTRESQLPYCGNCMISAINYSHEIEGKAAILLSYPGGDGTLYRRVNGIIAIGLIDKATNQVDWKYHYPVNKAPYYYSCLTELPDGTIGLLYEYEEFAIRYQVYTLEELIAGGSVSDTEE